MKNSLPNARIVDFGASRKCNEDGVALSNKPFPLDPIYFYNKDALNLGAGSKAPIYSIQTDIFSYRMFMIESMAFYAGASKSEIDQMHLNGLQQPAQTNPAINSGKPRDVDILAANDDATRISNTLANLEKYLQGKELISALSGVNDNTIHFTREAIATYKAYLTSPIPQGNKQEVIEQNQKAFAATQPAAMPKPNKQQARLLNALNHIRNNESPDKKYDALTQLVAKNAEMLGGYDNSAKYFILHQAREYALIAARDKKDGCEVYKDLAKALDDIIRSTGTIDQKFKNFTDYTRQNYANKTSTTQENKDSSKSMRY